MTTDRWPLHFLECFRVLKKYWQPAMLPAAYIVLSVTIHWLKEKNEEIKMLPLASVRKTSPLLSVSK